MEILNYINGEWAKPNVKENLDVINPATGQVIAKTPIGTKVDVETSAKAASDAFPAWRQTPVQDRVQYLFKLRELLKANHDEIARMITNECGKTFEEAKAEMVRAIYRDVDPRLHGAAALSALAHLEDLVARGLRQTTHTFNAMEPLNHREPGTVGAALTLPQLSCELIADNIHVHPAAQKILVDAKTPAGVILITDAIRPAGLPPGDYMLDDRPVNNRTGAVRLADGTLAGSVLTMERALQNICAAAGRSLAEMWPASSLNAARAIGVIASIAGVYAVRARMLGITDERWHHGVMNIGVRPTFTAGRSIEVHLLDIAPELYGTTLRVECIARLRDETRFDGVEAAAVDLHEPDRAERGLGDSFGADEAARRMAHWRAAVDGRLAPVLRANLMEHSCVFTGGLTVNRPNAHLAQQLIETLLKESGVAHMRSTGRLEDFPVVMRRRDGRWLTDRPIAVGEARELVHDAVLAPASASASTSALVLATRQVGLDQARHSIALLGRLLRLGRGRLPLRLVALLLLSAAAAAAAAAALLPRISSRLWLHGRGRRGRLGARLLLVRGGRIVGLSALLQIRWVLSRGCRIDRLGGRLLYLHLYQLFSRDRIFLSL